MLNKDHVGVLFAHVSKDHALSYGAAETADSLILRVLLNRCEVKLCMSDKQAMLVNNRICSKILFC
jgi:hypothetical protein